MILEKENIDSGCLKSSPVYSNAEISATRASATYEDLSDRFRHKKKDFTNQYGPIYVNRINYMADAVRTSSRNKWGNGIPMLRLSEEDVLGYERCIIIGILYKDQSLKPSILRDLSTQNDIVPPPILSNYVSSADRMYLEDGIHRICLVGNIDCNKLVTGTVAGVLGSQARPRIFYVEDIVFPNLSYAIDRPIDNSSNEGYILMVSGLSIGDPESLLPAQLLIDWIIGELGSPSDQKNQSQICRVIIAGNSIQESYRFSKKKLDTRFFLTELADEPDSVKNTKLLDKLLLDLVKSVPVDILPGECDPSNYLLPQLPFHKSSFPQCIKYKTLNRVPNPYECIIQGRRLFGSSGQPIKNIKAVTDCTDDLEILENTLYWSHVAPTAPETLGCYPFNEKDPFIITDQPDIYFAGNTSSFGTKTIHLNGRPVCIVSIPNFANSQTCALINLKNLECIPLHFKIFEKS